MQTNEEQLIEVVDEIVAKVAEEKFKGDKFASNLYNLMRKRGVITDFHHRSLISKYEAIEEI